MGQLKKLLILFSLLLLISKNYGQQTSEKWLQDYEFIKLSLIEGYSNLDWIKKEGEIDIVSLDKKTKEALSKASSKNEVKTILDNFLSAFNDGHLELFQNNNYLITENTEKFNSKTTAKDLCSYIGNSNVSTKEFSLPFEKLTSFKLISKNSDPFTIGLFKLENGKQFAVLRISIFSPDFYTQSCEEIWEIYRNSISDTCGDNCLNNFSIKLANSLLEKLNQQLEILQKNKFEALIVDIGDNGGGTNWVDAIARTLTSKPLYASKFALVKHPKSVEIFESNLKEINLDLENKNLNKKEKQFLTSAKKNLEKLITQAKNNCNNSTFWTSNESLQTCMMTTSAPFFASGLFPYLNKNEIKNLNSKFVLFSPSLYNYKESSYKGKLVVLINRNTASAAEYFAALLKDNNAAEILGEKTYGAGGGFVDGGVEYILPNTKFILKIPNCTRYRADGSNEFIGVESDVPVWNKTDDNAKKLDKLLMILQNVKN